jgi:hypothetical protein
MKRILGAGGLVTKGNDRAWAVTSPDGVYRYLLGRTWEGSAQEVTPLWCFGMLNPSKARHDIDDPTVRRCAGFAKRGGAGGFLIVNLLAYSSTHPREMVRASSRGIDVRGEHNDAAIRWAIARATAHGRHVAAWGVVPSRLRGLAAPGIRSFLARPADCLGINVDGSPKHPLRLGYDRPIVTWNVHGADRPDDRNPNVA